MSTIGAGMTDYKLQQLLRMLGRCSRWQRNDKDPPYMRMRASTIKHWLRMYKNNYHIFEII